MRWLALMAVLLSAGCATDVGPTPAELKARWDAQNVVPQSYKSDILAFMRTYLNDPEHVRGAMVSQPVLKPVGAGDRYITCLRYRERRDGGVYRAAKDGVATFVSGKLDRYFDSPEEVKALCKDVALDPFPELEKLKR